MVCELPMVSDSEIACDLEVACDSAFAYRRVATTKLAEPFRPRAEVGMLQRYESEDLFDAAAAELPLRAPEPTVALDVCNRGLAAASANDHCEVRATCEPTGLPLRALEPLVAPEVRNGRPELACVNACSQLTPLWYDKLQGPWETSRLGYIRVVGDFVHCATGALLRLSLAADGRAALSNWRADLQKLTNKLEWTRPDDPTGQDLVLWVRPASHSSAPCHAAMSDAEQKPLQALDPTPFDALQGRWDATRYGPLCVSGDAVRYDACDQGQEPLRLGVAPDGRITLLSWSAQAQPGVQTLRWTDGDAADVIIWVRMPDGPERPLELRLQHRAVVGKARVVRPRAPSLVFHEPDRTLRDRSPMQRLYSRALAFGVMPVAAGPVAARPVERKELQKLKKTVDKYQSEIEKLKKKMKRNRKKMSREKADARAGKMDARAEQAGFKLARQKALPKTRPMRKPEEVPVITADINRKRPRAKATAMKALKTKKLADATVWQKELAVQTVELALQNEVKPNEGKSVVAAHQVLSKEQKAELQKKIDELDDDHFDQVLAFLEPELGNPGDDEIRLDLDTLSQERLHALVAMVKGGLHQRPQSEEQPDSLTGYC